VLAVVAALLFGAMGARLWFLQTVQAESLQQTVDARKTKTVRLVPERGRIFDAEAGSSPTTSGADRQRRLGRDPRDTDRAQLFTRLSGWLDVPVADMEARYDAKLYSRYKPLPLKEDVAPNVAVAIQERSRGLPRRLDRHGWKRVYPYARWPATCSATWARSPPTTSSTTRTSATTRRSTARRSGGRRRAVDGDALHGKWGEVVYEVDANNRIVRQLSYEAPVNGEDVQLSIDLDLQQYAERLLQTQLAPEAPVHVAEPEVTKPDGTRGPLDEHSPSGRRCTTGAGRLDGRARQPDRAVLAMASYPTFDNLGSPPMSGGKFAQLFPTYGGRRNA
jgi:penicillin-binding protein 2